MTQWQCEECGQIIEHEGMFPSYVTTLLWPCPSSKCKSLTQTFHKLKHEVDGCATMCVEEIFSNIEKQYNIKIVFAVESGSRAWDFASKNSDYDIRAVHINSLHSLLSIKEPPCDVLHVNHKGFNIDFESWDIKKFATLLLKSNPTVHEWLSSNIIYRDSNVRKIFKKMFNDDASLKALTEHYKSLAKQNYQKYINVLNETVSYKKYLYVLRAIAAISYMNHQHMNPPIQFSLLKQYLPKEIYLFAEEIIKNKQDNERYEGKPNKDVNKYIEKFLDSEMKPVDEQCKFDVDAINDIVINASIGGIL